MNCTEFTVLLILSVALLRPGVSYKSTTGERKEGGGEDVREQQRSLGQRQGHSSISSIASSQISLGLTQSERLSSALRGASPSQEHRSRVSRKVPDFSPGDGTSRTATLLQIQRPRTRVTRGLGSKPNSANRRLAGPNVCGGQQCCSGWAVAPGTNRCIKPDCQPPCQNRGSCSRPHTCVCRSGFQGPRCEEVAPEQVYIRERGTLRRVEPGTNLFHRERQQRRPSERVGSDLTKAQTPRPLPPKQPVHTRTHGRHGLPDSSPQHTGTSRTVKRYPSSSGPITSNALPSANGKVNGHGSERQNWYDHRNGHSNVPSGPHTPRQSSNRQQQGEFNNALLPAGANLTSSLDRIKIVFTPMKCNRVCNGGRCYNNCEKGDITTVYSENSQQHQQQHHHQQQQQQQKNQGFRLFFCQIPCLNGGQCIGRDQCWCPSNSTGKFCHLAAPPPARPTPHSRTTANRQRAKSPSQSMYTLPLSNQQVSLHPSLVNVHVQHPPEAEVQIHQVARVHPGHRTITTDGAHSVQQRSQPGNGHEYPSEHSNNNFHSNGQQNGHTRTHSHHNEVVGRCFQDTADGQCGEPLPGLTKQDDCCGSVGASWGLNKCQKCPTKPAYAVIANGQVHCPKGFKRMNATHCQDINECLLPGICKNADCLNAKGSYRCTCKPGFMLDAARSHCVSDKAFSDQRAHCYRSISGGICSLPLVNHITKQICCCSRVGKAWGPSCDRCPLPGSDHFKEICPAGHGYTYSRSDVQISLRQMEEDELQHTGVFLEEQDPSSLPSLNFPSESQYPSYPETPQVPQYPNYPERPQEPPLTPQHPSDSGKKVAEGVEILLPPTYATDSPQTNPGVNQCFSMPSICGRGRCIPTQTGYSCVCDPGFKFNALQTNCIDINECDDNPCDGKGHCINSYGSYSCQCHSGYSQVITQNRKFCQDINECNVPNKCQNGKCVNTEGSYTCECNSGYAKSPRGLCEDMDECKDPTSCPSGVCINTPGSFQCQACSTGFRPVNERCVDINECLNQTVCGHGRCVNTWGSYRCNCFHGYKLSPDKACHDVDECAHPEVCDHGHCVNVVGTYECTCDHGYQQTSNRKSCEDVNECASGNACPVGICTNTPGSYTCQNCRPGFGLSVDGMRCEDIDECAQGDMCLGGMCANKEGSFICTRCRAGYRVSQDQRSCEDIDECQSLSTCPNGICLNSEGSYSCENCPAGYSVSYDGEYCKDIDECALPTTCPQGTCTNTEGSFTCVVCQPGFKVSEDGQQCDDVDECLGSNVCPGSLCLNTQGSYTCRSCETGFQLSEDDHTCQDIDECQTQGVCPAGVCTNTEGSFSCTACDPGFAVTPNGLSCEDVNECENTNVCEGGQCTNSIGSYSCSCPPGFELVDETSCRDINECLTTSGICGEGDCVNTKGSYSCTCPNGYTSIDKRPGCQDVDECSRDEVCVRGQCINTDGSFLCLCEAGFKFNTDTTDCEDQDECKEFGDFLCGTWQCQNTIGSYKCLMRCQPGSLEENCNINECDNETICGDHGFCDNTDGFFRCQCDRGYTNPVGDTTRCVDVNECEMSSAMCGEALCENYDGSFLCICPNDNEEFDPNTSRCRSMAETQPTVVKPHAASSDERKECYYNLNDANYCNNVLSRNTTKQECCCTVGAGWGDNCEIHACPLPGKDDYNQLCPHGSGVLPLSSQESHGNQLPYIDANECEMFGSEICKNGQCSNIFSSYTCFCRSGFYYDNVRLECIDHDECHFGNPCENGACVNTAGSFNCFCSPPFVLDNSRRRCISLNTSEETFEYDSEVHEDICWRRLEGDNMCADPLPERRTTYTECCCLYGIAWSGQCAFCPRKDSADFVAMCNLRWEGGSDSLRDQIGFEYGPEEPDDRVVHFPPPYWDNYGNPAGTYELPDSIPVNSRDYNERQPPLRVPVVQPGSPPQQVHPHRERYDAFEGPRAEECGVLNGCENGRCVRVEEGYTCDCFDGYQLDLSKMACVDINECKDISDHIPLCINGICSNTEGSYKCTCLSGFVASAKPHTCIPTIPEIRLRESDN